MEWRTYKNLHMYCGWEGLSQFKPVLQIFINTSDIIRVFKKPVSLARRRKKMDGLEFLAELAPIYRVFPSLPFTLPPTSPNTHVIACRKKNTNTNRHCVYALIKPKISQKTNVTHRHILQTPAHTTYTSTKPKTQQFQCNHFRVYSNQV